MKNKHFFLKLSIPFALFYWLFDSAMHFLVYGELEFEIIPADVDELWMRCMIVILLVAFGLFADYHTQKVSKQEKEKYDVYNAMLHATNHILNNFLNNMILFRLEAEKSEDFDKELLKLYDQVIVDTTAQIKQLESIHNPNKDIIKKTYMPK